jgi:hypothetical protein
MNKKLINTYTNIIEIKFLIFNNKGKSLKLFYKKINKDRCIKKILKITLTFGGVKYIFIYNK